MFGAITSTTSVHNKNHQDRGSTSGRFDLESIHHFIQFYAVQSQKESIIRFWEKFDPVSTQFSRATGQLPKVVKSTSDFFHTT